MYVLGLFQYHGEDHLSKLSRLHLITKWTMLNSSLSDSHKLFLSDFFSIGSHVCSVLASCQGLSYLGDKHTHWLKEGA